jgi:hypothetical protein
MNNADFPEFAISYSKNAATLRDELSAGTRELLIDIQDALADNPEKYPSRLISLENGVFIYRHPKPRFEVTYRIDRERKIIYFLHLVSPALEVNKSLFISYSHQDEKWLLELKKWLKPLEQRDLVTIWDD